MIPPPPRFPDSSTRDTIRAALARAGYREDELRSRLPEVDFERPRPVRSSYLERRIGEVEGVLGALLRTFFLGLDLPIDDAEAELGLRLVAALDASGLARVEDDALRPRVSFSTTGDMVLAGDLRRHHRAGRSDFVPGPLPVTRRLAAFAMWPPGGSVLDLGCGSGTLAARAARRAGGVLATDVNPRAVGFARFNAELNGLDNVRTCAGDLFGPVGGERFDLIVCNPPYVLSPDETYAYRDGGPEFCRRIVREAPRYLSEDGCLQMMTEWPERSGADWRNEILSWAEGLEHDLWVLRIYSAESDRYAHHWLGQEYPDEGPPAKALTSWVEHLESMDAASVGGGILILRRTPSSDPIRTLRDIPAWNSKGAGESLARWISAQSLLRRCEDLEELLRIPLAPAPGLQSIRRRTAAGDGWCGSERQLRIPEGLRFGAEVDPVAEEIVGLLDGGRMPREALEELTDRHGLDPEHFLDGLPGALARLLELGILEPARDASPG